MGYGKKQGVCWGLLKKTSTSLSCSNFHAKKPEFEGALVSPMWDEDPSRLRIFCPWKISEFSSKRRENRLPSTEPFRGQKAVRYPARVCFPGSFTTWAENSSYITYRGQLPIYFRPCYTWRIIPVSNVLNNRGDRVRPRKHRVVLFPFQMAELDGL